MSYIHSIAGNFWLALGLYWAPVAVCLYWYSCETWSDYRHDIARRQRGDLYVPFLTVGTILARVLISVVPVFNLLATIFRTGPQLISEVIDWLSQVFDVPLVPAKKDKKP